MSAPLYGGNTGGTVFDSSIAFNDATPTSQLQFTVTPSDSTNPFVVKIDPPTGGPLTETSYTTTESADATNPDLNFSPCGPAAGTLDIYELVAAAADQPITAFAAHYTFTCDGAPTFSGELRWQSSVGYQAVTRSPVSWDFGDQVIKANGPAKTFTFRNRGSLPVTFGTAPTLTGSTTAFSITHDTCYPNTIAPDLTCAITVTPHPQYPVSSTYFGSVATLHLAADALAGQATLPRQAVPLRVEGHKYYSIYLRPGPARIQFTWGQLPGTIGASIVNYSVYRRTSSTSFAFLKHVSGLSTTDYTVTPGKAYYYSVRPNYGDGSGVLSPTVAAEAWPKYSAGMYHRLSSPARLVSGHKVSAGSKYLLKVLGGHGIPGSHVSAVALNVTATKPSKSTSVTVYPTGATRPTQPDLKLKQGATRSNFVLAKVGSNGRITITTTHGTTPVTVDVTGYYSGTGLSSKYGMGGAAHTYVDSGWILDTKKQGFGPLPSGYYVNAPVNFSPIDTPHITSLAVRITAYGSKGSGSITAFRTGGSPSGTSVLSYSANSTTSNFAIVRAGLFFGTTRAYPSIAFLNRGSKSVQLIVTIVGYYDDNTFWYGERYTPTAPVHFGVTNPLHSGSVRTINAGSHAGTWSTALNLKIAASPPTATTMLSLWPNISGISAPAHGQLHADVGQATVASTPVALGIGNRFYLRNSAGTTSVSLWSFGRFDAWPQPSTRSYASVGSTATSMVPQTVAPGPANVAAGAIQLR